MVCRAMNTTEKPIKLKAGVAVGALTAVTVPQQDMSQRTHNEQLPTVSEMQETLQKLDISLKDTALLGQDFDNLVALLYRNRDLIATSVAELPGCDVLMHRIDTGNHPPIRKRAYRQSPLDRAEIARQVKEMQDAGIVQISESPWSAPVILITKRDGTRRFVIDFRGLNSVTTMTAWPLPTIDEVLDTIADEKPTLWTSLDLKSGYWQAKLEPSCRDRTAFQVDGFTVSFNGRSEFLSEIDVKGFTRTHHKNIVFVSG